MIVISENAGQIIEDTYNTGVGLGNFDGLHIGHMKLIRTLIDECEKEGLKSLVYTFTKHPENIMRKALFTPLLTSVGKKTELLSDTGLDILYLAEFDEVYSRMEPVEFVEKVLVDRLKIRLAVVGYNYHFGYMGRGDTTLLKQLGEKYGFRVIVVSPVEYGGMPANSTLIRQLIAEGDVKRAEKFLGRPYSMKGMVVHGRSIGRSLGFPTANMFLENHLVIPQKGVYVTRTLYEENYYRSITNVGFNPTIGSDKISVETHLMDFDEDMYDKQIEVFFYDRIRGEVKFNSREELSAQIKKDYEYARNYFCVHTRE